MLGRRVQPALSHEGRDALRAEPAQKPDSGRPLASGKAPLPRNSQDADAAAKIDGWLNSPGLQRPR